MTIHISIILVVIVMLAEAGSLMLQRYHAKIESDATVQEGAIYESPS